jgi:ATP-binding cassette, subfamily B, bacterial PglK
MTAPIIENMDDKVDVIHGGFSSDVFLDNVSLIYPGKSAPAIKKVSLTIPSGKSVAFVGPSGAGKLQL